MLELSYCLQFDKKLISNSLECIYSMTESNTNDRLPTVIACNDHDRISTNVAVIPVYGNSTMIFGIPIRDTSASQYHGEMKSFEYQGNILP